MAPKVVDMSRLFLALLVAVASATAVAPARAQPMPPAQAAAEPMRFAIAIKNRKADVAQQQIRVRQGDTVELSFTSDEPAELHLHGYDKLLMVAPDAPAVLRFPASIAGHFSVEAHAFGINRGRASGQIHVVLLYFDVYPR